MPSRFLNNIRVNDSYTLPSADGDASQIIQTDGDGQLSFVDLSSIEGAASNFVYFEVKNETGSTINKGKGVRAVGTDGNSGHILIDEMIADGSVESKYFLGVLETTVANGGFARVISFGQLDQFNTLGQNGETWSDGDILWCDPANDGDFTITEPDGPNVKIAAAFILNSSTNGKIQVRVQANEGIHDLHDTRITSQVDGDVLVWNNTDGVWFNNSTLNVDYTAGKVGIGTDSPTALLTLESSSFDPNPGIDIKSTASTPGSKIRFLDSSGSEVSTMESFSNPVIRHLQLNYGSTVAYSSTLNLNDGFLYLSTAGSERMRIKSNGDVGIGTTDPNAKLEVVGTTGVIVDSGSNSAALLTLKGDASSYGGGGQINIIGGNTDYMYYSTNIIRSGSPNINEARESYAMYGHTWTWDGNMGNTAFQPYTSYNFKSQGSSQMVIYNNNVGIGTTSPFDKLEVAAANSQLRLRDTDDNNFAQFSYSSGKLVVRNNSTTTTVNQFTLDSIGRMGIGTTSPAEKLHVNGNARATQFKLDASTAGMRQSFGTMYLESNQGARFQNTSGTLKPVTASAFNDTSDYRLKSNIVPLENAISRLNQLEVRRFNWNDRLDEPKVDGFIAHEVAPIIPEAVLGEKDAVHEDGTPNYQGIDKSKIVPLLTAALQEAISKIEQLETRIQTLENK
jgi:hypothetical protein